MIRVFTMTQLTLFTSRQKLFDCSYRLSPPNLSFEALEHFVALLEGDFPTAKGLKRNGKGNVSKNQCKVLYLDCII